MSGFFDDTLPAGRSALLRIRTLGPITYSFELRHNYVVASYTRGPETPEEMAQWSVELDTYLQRRGRRHLLLDCRFGDPLPDEVQQRFWTWAKHSPRVDDAAILVHDRFTKAKLFVSSLLRGRRPRVFSTAGGADRWMLKKDKD